jgi:hypothetical protein
MEKHWTENLGNVSSRALQKSWLQLAENFKNQIINHNDPTLYSQWRVLSHPCGAGKTQSTIQYAAKLADNPDGCHPGILIVTRLKAGCDELVSQINQYGSRVTAVGYHGDTDTPLSALAEYPVVVITHRAFEIAVGLLSMEGEDAAKSKWSCFQAFHGQFPNTRKLIVVDEAIDLCEPAKADLDGLRATLGVIPQAVRDRCPGEITALQSVIDQLEMIHNEGKGGQSTRHINFNLEYPPSFAGLLSFLQLNQERFDPKREHEYRMKQLQHILKQWAYYHRSAAEGHTFRSSRSLLPDQCRGAVVLDATAMINGTYKIQEQCELIPPPKGSRRYKNVTIHFTRYGMQAGKTRMQKVAPELFPKLIKDLNTRFSPDQKVLVVSHLSTEHFLKTEPAKFQLCTSHWGELDGSNEWQNCDAVVLAGLPYLPTYWSINTVIGAKGEQSDEWLGTEGRDERRELRLTRMAAYVVQAINRGKARRVINTHGDCEKTDVYIVKPFNKEEVDRLITLIREAMPEINIKSDWEFTPSKITTQKPRESGYEGLMLTFLKNMAPGRINKTHVENTTGISRATLTRIITKIRANDSEFARAVAGVGVRVNTIREGKVFKTYFVKDEKLS